MTWRVELSEQASRQIKRLDTARRRRIDRFLAERIASIGGGLAPITIHCTGVEATVEFVAFWFEHAVTVGPRRGATGKTASPHFATE